LDQGTVILLVRDLRFPYVNWGTRIVFLRNTLLAVLATGWTLSGASFNSLASFQGATSGLTLINFDGTSGSLAGVYTSVGVDFRPESYASVAIGPVSSPNGWFDDDFVNGEPFFPASFNANAGSVTAVGLHHVLYSGYVATLIAYDAANTVIATANSDGDPNNNDFFGVTTASPIARFEVVFQSHAGWGLDDLYFGTSSAGAVPEPSSALLVIPVAMAIAHFRRRR
jgi:hypothetical protein